MASCLSRRDLKIHSIFKNVFIGAPRPFIQMVSKWKGVFIEMDLLPTVIINSFKIQNQTFERHFHFFSWLYDHEIYSFLETSARFIMTKVSETQVYSFHAHADIIRVSTFFKKHIHEWKHSWSKDKQKLSLVDPYFNAPDDHWQVLWIWSDLRRSEIEPCL